MRELYQNGKLVDACFTYSKKRVFLRLVKQSRKRSVSLINTMLISDLVKKINISDNFIRNRIILFVMLN